MGVGKERGTMLGCVDRDEVRGTGRLTFRGF